jgi:hypothetical protein
MDDPIDRQQSRHMPSPSQVRTTTTGGAYLCICIDIDNASRAGYVYAIAFICGRSSDAATTQVSPLRRLTGSVQGTSLWPWSGGSFISTTDKMDEPTPMAIKAAVPLGSLWQRRRLLHGG